MPVVSSASLEALASLVDAEVLPPSAAWRVACDAAGALWNLDENFAPHACVAVALARLIGALARAPGSFAGGARAVDMLWRLMACADPDIVGAAACAAACADVAMLGFRFDIDDAKDAAAIAVHDRACDALARVALTAPLGALAGCETRMSARAGRVCNVALLRSERASGQGADARKSSWRRGRRRWYGATAGGRRSCGTRAGRVA